MEQTILKAKMERLIHNRPEEASIEEAMEKLYLLYKIEKGIQQADAGKTLPHEEAKKTTGRMARQSHFISPIMS